MRGGGSLDSSEKKNYCVVLKFRGSLGPYLSCKSNLYPHLFELVTSATACYMHYWRVRHTTLKCCKHQLELGQPYFQGKSHSYKWWQGKSELSYSSCLMRKIENGDLNTSVFLFLISHSSCGMVGRELELQAAQWDSHSVVTTLHACDVKGNPDGFIHLWDGKIECFRSSCLESHVFPANGISVDADLCITEGSDVPVWIVVSINLNFNWLTVASSERKPSNWFPRHENRDRKYLWLVSFLRFLIQVVCSNLNFLRFRAAQRDSYPVVTLLHPCEAKWRECRWFYISVRRTPGQDVFEVTVWTHMSP